MSTISLSGADTIVIDGRSLTDFADQNYGDLSYPGELSSMKTGKNGNTIIALNTMGLQATLKLRVIRGSSDDKYLNEYIALFKADPAAFEVMAGEVVKRAGDGSGNVTLDSYLMSVGVPGRQVAATNNAEGDTEQAVSVYEFKFANSDRGIL